MIRVALIGCGTRGTEVYLPVLAKMTDHFRLVAVGDEKPARAEAAEAASGARAFGELDRLLEEARPELAVVAVTPPPSHRNATVALRCIEAGVPVLCETPIAPTLPEADLLVECAKRGGVAAEVAENYSRTPWERLKRLLIKEGVFGEVHVVYSDFVGHGYHGVSVLRGHVGFEVPVARVIGLSQDYSVERHLHRPGEWRDSETWQFGVLEFANGSRGVLSFSTLSYGSPLRGGRSHCAVRFHAERGLGVGRSLAILDDSRETRPIRVEERHTTVDGEPTLDALVTDLPGRPAWENPLRSYPLGVGDQHDELTIGLQLASIHAAITAGAEPEYPLERARVDREIDLALSGSRSLHGAPVTLGDLPGGDGR